MPNSLKSRLKGLVWRGLLSKKDLSRIYTDNDVVEELEKIKAEIMSIGNWREHYEMPITYLSCLTIVEHHISELKGETE